MSALLTEVVFSGKPNRWRRLTDDEVADLLGRFEDLRPAVKLEPICWTCSGRGVFQLFPDGPENAQYVVREDTVTRACKSGGESLLETRVHAGTAFLRGFSALAISDTLRTAIDGDRHFAVPKYCEVLPSPVYPPCPCGAPEDFDRWASRTTLFNNSCYNFALKDTWCGDCGGYPIHAPTNGSMPQWSEVLSGDGLIEVPDMDTVPPGCDPDAGWHVALALNTGSDAHFLRLDAGQNRWTHKFASHLPQTCDGNGNDIPRDGILTANLCGYRVQAFYWAREGLRIRDAGDGCTPPLVRE